MVHHSHPAVHHAVHHILHPVEEDILPAADNRLAAEEDNRPAVEVDNHPAEEVDDRSPVEVDHNLAEVARNPAEAGHSLVEVVDGLLAVDHNHPELHIGRVVGLHTLVRLKGENLPHLEYRRTSRSTQGEASGSVGLSDTVNWHGYGTATYPKIRCQVYRGIGSSHLFLLVLKI